MWSVSALHCKRCGNMLGIVSPEKKEGLINDLNGHCPRCNKKLDSSSKGEYHYEYYFILKSIIWKLTHPWRLFK